MMKFLVSALWVAGGVIAAANGSLAVIPVVLAYMAYLWLFDGRWLIY